jgi:small-conductance mechanosensitive channel
MLPRLRRRPAPGPGLRLGADFRRSVAYVVLAVAAYGASRGLDVHSHGSSKIAAYSCGAAFVLLGLEAVRTAANEFARLMRAHAGDATGASVRVLVLIVGYVLVLLLALDVFAVPVGNLLLGGAVTGIILGIAAQQALGSLFAGLVLLVSRPYVPGQRIRVVGGSVGAQEGVVVSVGLVYTTLATDDGPLNIPNSALLGASVGPAPRSGDAGGPLASSG